MENDARMGSIVYLLAMRGVQWMVESWGIHFVIVLMRSIFNQMIFNLKAILWFLRRMDLYLIKYIFADKPSSVCLTLTQGKMKTSERM